MEVSPLDAQMTDRAMAYGDGLFATLRVENGQILWCQQHLERLSQGAQRLGFELVFSAEIRTKLTQLTASNSGCLKLHISRGEGGRGYQASASAQPIVRMSFHSLPDCYPHWHSHGIRLQTSSVRLGRQPLLAGIKHLNRLEQVLIKQERLAPSYDDYLVFDADGFLVETSVGNIFLVNNGRVLTPHHGYAGVAGMARTQSLLALVDMGYSIECRSLTVNDLQQADHVFTTNSLYGVVDVTQVDLLQFQRWPNTVLLRQKILC
ncbi:aminodeoxychorismate lyase [Shewanella sp. NIFS-20-20]|uniref:aminodeoxychorismate lyase n=1 Tax=Shewanella sp. NIFS-20-20 TaxID=2853806 RepID=UPI001C445A2A|nr:aminodeoxychorismate lyase [Shewanella sp. NIFS-20-20]MBV7314595.1 aminodeoxychorismate lyase [Shewanella sp. NIFS-20-20]